MRVRLDLAPEPPDHHVDGAVERLEPPARRRVEQRVAAEDAPRVAREEAQQRHCAARQRHRLARVAREQQASRSRTRPAKRTGAWPSLDGVAPSILTDSTFRMGRSHNLQLRNCYTQD